jgi:hypothetical protein
LQQKALHQPMPQHGVASPPSFRQPSAIWKKNGQLNQQVKDVQNLPPW